MRKYSRNPMEKTDHPLMVTNFFKNRFFSIPRLLPTKEIKVRRRDIPIRKIFKNSWTNKCHSLEKESDNIII